MLLGVGKEKVIRYLHLKALDLFKVDIWNVMRSDLLSSASRRCQPSQHSLRDGAFPDPKDPGPCVGLRRKASIASLRAPRTPQHEIDLNTLRVGTGPLLGTIAEEEPNDTMSMSNFLAVARLSQFTQALRSIGFEDLERLLEITEDHMQAVGMGRGHMVKLRNGLLAISEGNSSAAAWIQGVADARRTSLADETHCSGSRLGGA
jgi:hypothetical protein